MRWSGRVCWAALLFCFAASADAQFVHTRGKEIVTADGKPLLLHGTNLGNWMVPEGYMWHFESGPQSTREIEQLVTELIGPERSRAFWESYRETYISREDVHLIRSAGFDSVRVPIHYKLFASEDAEGFRLLDRVVKWCREERLFVIIDLHAARGEQTGANIDDSDGYPWLFKDASAQQQTIDLWRRIAHHYSDDPTVLGYDLLNEPIPSYPKLRPLDPLLEPLYKRITEAIRTVDKNHIVILGGAQWDTDFSVFGKPFDNNLVYQFHTYWAPPAQQTIQNFLNFRERMNVPIWLGESGENKDEWIAQLARLLEQSNIGWAFWPYKKMDSTSSPVTFFQPEGWSTITDYARLDRGLGHIEDRLAKRPSQEAIDRAFASLLQQIQFTNEKKNMGYIRALIPATALHE